MNKATKNYSQLPIFNKELNTADKDPFWAEFKKAQTETYKCGECEKILISREKLDLDFFWVGELQCKECNDKAKNQHLCSDCYLAKLEKGDPIITKDFNTYHNFNHA